MYNQSTQGGIYCLLAGNKRLWIFTEILIFDLYQIILWETKTLYFWVDFQIPPGSYSPWSKQNSWLPDIYSDMQVKWFDYFSWSVIIVWYLQFVHSVQPHFVHIIHSSWEFLNVLPVPLVSSRKRKIQILLIMSWLHKLPSRLSVTPGHSVRQFSSPLFTPLP